MKVTQERQDKNQDPKAFYLNGGSFYCIELPLKQKDTQQKIIDTKWVGYLVTCKA